MSSDVKGFAHALRSKLREDMNNYADDVATGDCKTFEEYKKICGVIQGLALAESYLIALLEKAETDDD